MDKKKKMIMKKILIILALFAVAFNVDAQDVKQIRFCDNKYEYGIGKDSITLFLKFLDSDGNRSANVTTKDLEEKMDIKENGNTIAPSRRKIESLSKGQRIPGDYTFSVLVDLSIPEDGKKQIYDVVGSLVESAPDSCVYLSFFGDEVTSSQLISNENYKDFKTEFQKKVASKYFYSALYSKLLEFDGGSTDLEESIKAEANYAKNSNIVSRAKRNKDKNLLFVFTEGSKRPEDEEAISFLEVTDYQGTRSHLVPKVYAFYYTGNGFEENVKLTLEGVTSPRDPSTGNVITERKGDYKPSDDLSSVLKDFEQVVQDAMYDFAFTYKVNDNDIYSGKTSYTAIWRNEQVGEGVYSIGTVENPWPTREESTVDAVIKYLVAILATLLTIVFFFCVMKIIVPYIKSKSFAIKYYKKYQPEANIQRRICHYCKQDIQPGQMVVMKCKHIMHVHCWYQNGYKCAEYGQNCKIGIQEHVDWKGLLSMSSIRDCYQTIAGICAGLVCWILYELMGRGGFSSIATGITKVFFTNEEQQLNLFDTCVTKVSAFLTIGFLLGFFLSLIFRFNDEYRKRDWKVYLKIIGLSLLSGIIGIGAFAVGSILLCVILSAINTTYIPWYCSLPAYLLFSVCISLGLTIKSTIPVKSAMIGGVCSAIIGFLVLYFSSITSSRYAWMNVLLDFVIYGGGLGASLVTIRLLAEKYFLVIQNGVKAGQKIPIHKWMNATGGGNKVSLGMTGECEIQMNWEKSNKVAKEHAQLFIDHAKSLPMIKPLATGVIFNTRAELPVGKPSVLSNGDTFKIGDTIFQYVETD